MLLLDTDGLHLRHGAAPSLPGTYARAIDGGAIGPHAGSCGTAAYRRAPVVVEDIEIDPLWAGFRDLARPHGLRACWSTPIFGTDTRVLGTFAMYFREPRRPEPRHQQIIAAATHMAAIAIEKQQREHALHESEERYRLLSLAINDIVWDWDAVVRSAIDFARNMGLQITAEGVEDDVTYRTLRDLGCNVAQGWFFSRALPADAFAAWLRESPWGHRTAAGR